MFQSIRRSSAERAFAPCARFGGEGTADIALASRLEDGPNFDQLSIVVLHVLDELAKRADLSFNFWHTPQPLKKSNTTLVGPSPAPGSWMHRFSSSMPLWRARRSASVAGGMVGALHVFLCFFQASFWHSAEQ